MSSRPLRAIIDLGALRNNVALTKGDVGRGARVWCRKG